MEDSTPFRIGVVGAGSIGRVHAGAAHTAGLEAAACVDSDEAARDAFTARFDAPAFADLDALLEAGVELDGLVIATPPSARLDLVTGALEAGLHVLVEKPLAASADESERLVALAESHPSLTTGVAYCHRFTPAVMEMKRMLASGELGRLLRFENVFACSIPDMPTKWMSDPALSGGGSLIDTGSHSLDLFMHLVGEPSVRAAVFDRAWPGRGEASSTVLLESPGGIGGVVMTGWCEPARFVLRLVGDRALVEYDYEQPETLRIIDIDGARTDRPVETNEVRFERQLAAFARQARGEETSLATFQHGARVASAIDAAHALAGLVES